jgi:hypothetical protein
MSLDGITAEEIREWDRTIRAGGSVAVPPGEACASLVLAVVRRVHALGADPTDENGAEAMRRVEEALA